MKFTINGKEQTVQVEGNPMLLEVFREQLELTGTKYGCGESVCGACKVMVNGSAVPSCITPAVSVQGKQVVTVEGLERDGALHPVQQVFLEVDPFQCGYCASGMLVTAVAFLDKNPSPSREEIVDAMNGNICRCCTYPAIIEAIYQASRKMA
ncbi:Isoquinoline 1-oxidoreductase alpha subunit [Lunatimonas lonarensis]|uniref:Isoquinoline 1-oxidoreductase alpha subunit n=1 Tax=Lunatimonas lonarensis TaxID=1232681 RepID=R7ZSR0_9BACT|nr:(2Fe-2S)-binding protein [Lunatimonas lonarensis]EON77160.1 Isoquinoline 1-oxidoreductase alpha subunit [Lunatimonas lonarensis]